jgi:hypothetical protein
MGERVRPGRSIIVKFGQFEEYISNMIGLSMIFLRFPQILLVNNYMIYLTLAKLVIFYDGFYAKFAYGYFKSF